NRIHTWGRNSRGPGSGLCFSFQRVLEEARHQLARHYLNNSVLELSEAGHLFGYDDSNSFVRAFRTREEYHRLAGTKNAGQMQRLKRVPNVKGEIMQKRK